MHGSAVVLHVRGSLKLSKGLNTRLVRSLRSVFSAACGFARFVLFGCFVSSVSLLLKLNVVKWPEEHATVGILPFFRRKNCRLPQDLQRCLQLKTQRRLPRVLVRQLISLCRPLGHRYRRRFWRLFKQQLAKQQSRLYRRPWRAKPRRFSCQAFLPFLQTYHHLVLA